LNLSNEKIIALLERYERESKALRHEALRISWSMRGGITYSDAMALSQLEREVISDIIKENMEITKESKMPFF
jgi:hypothetical protein